MDGEDDDEIMVWDDDGNLIEDKEEDSMAVEEGEDNAVEAEEAPFDSKPNAPPSPTIPARVATRTIWDIACSHNILPLLDTKMASNRGQEKASQDKLPVCLISDNTFFSTEEQKAAAHLAPAVRWLNNAPHLSGHCPFLFVVEGPADSASPASTSTQIPASSFNLRPRFHSYGSLTEQVKEYEEMRADAWSSPAKFIDYWTDIFHRNFLKSIEAKAPVLAQRLSEMIDPDDPNRSGPRLEDVKRLLYLTMRSDYATYCANTVDGETGRPRSAEAVAKFKIARKKDSLGKLSSKKRKRDSDNEDRNGLGSSSGDHSNDSNDIASLESKYKTLIRYFGQADADDYKMHRESDKLEARQAIGWGAITMESHYDTMCNSFREALEIVKQIVFSKTKKVSAARSQLISSLANSGKYLTGVPDDDDDNNNNNNNNNDDHNSNDHAIISATAILDENSMDVDLDATSNHATSSDQVKLNKAVAAVDRMVVGGALTCTEIARRLMDLWGMSILKLRDNVILDQYYKQHGLGGHGKVSKRPTLLESAGIRLNQESRYKLLIPFATYFYFSHVALTAGILQFFKQAPCWILPLVRMWHNNRKMLEHFNTNFTIFASFISEYDNISSSLAKSLLLFVHDLAKRGAPLDEQALELIIKMEAGNAVGNSIFDMAYRASNEHAYSIASFLKSIQVLSPNATNISNARWSCAAKILSTLDSHFTQRMNFQVDLYNAKLKGTRNISPYLYYIAPPSVIYITEAIMLLNNPEQTIYFCRDSQTPGGRVILEAPNETQLIRADSEMVEIMMTHRQSGYTSSSSHSMASANINKERPSIWACRRSHFVAWLEICDFIKTNRVIRLGEWSDYLSCRTAVDQSILMALIGLEYIGPNSTNGLVVYIPLAITMQLYTRLNTRRDAEDRWTVTWLRLTEKPYAVATMETLEEALQDFPNHPNIYIVHGEAMMVDEWLAIRRIYSKATNVKRREELILAGEVAARIYTTFSPVLGGFSNDHLNCGGQNYSLFMDSGDELFESEQSIDIARIKKRQPPSLWLPNSWRAGSKYAAIGSDRGEGSGGGGGGGGANGRLARDQDLGLTSREANQLFKFCYDLLMLGDATISADPKSRYQERPKVIIGTSRDLYLAPLSMPDSDYTTVVTEYLQVIRSSDNVLQYQTIGGNHRTGARDAQPETSRSKSSKRVPPSPSSPASTSSRSTANGKAENFNFDDDDLLHITKKQPEQQEKKKKPLMPIKQYNIPLGLAMAQMSIPDYQIVQYCELHPRITPLYVIDMGENDFKRISPMRLASILARSRQHTYCLANGEVTWRRWVSYWRHKSIDEMTYMTQSQLPSIPILAYSDAGITPDDIIRMEQKLARSKAKGQTAALGKRQSVSIDDVDKKADGDDDDGNVYEGEDDGGGDSEDLLDPVIAMRPHSSNSSDSTASTRLIGNSNGSEFMLQDETTQEAWSAAAAIASAATSAMSPPPTSLVVGAASPAPARLERKKNIGLRVATSSLSNSQNSQLLAPNESSNASRQDFSTLFKNQNTRDDS